MRAPARFVRALAGDRKGATAIEYGLILAMIVLAMMAALIRVANVTNAMWGEVSEKVQTAG